MASRFQEPVRGVSLDAVLATIPSLPRPVLSRLVARLIDHLDQQDGDPDLEPEQDECLAGDDGCGPVYRNGYKWWGTAEDEQGAQMPIYGIDQSAGPVTN